MSHHFITLHLFHNLPLHNLNSDANGQPKSQFDGGIQRGRLSSQSLKRAARIMSQTLNHGAVLGGGSVRTLNAADLALDSAKEHAANHGYTLDEAAAAKEIARVLKALVKGSKGDTDTTSTKEAAEDDDKNKNPMYFARHELSTLGALVADNQAAGNTTPVARNQFILDAVSPSLDIAANGRMFANDPAADTHAAIAVSHAFTTHPMTLTIDYFTAVDDHNPNSKGASFIGMAALTQGVYYHTVTIDTAQLRRAWTNIDGDGARSELTNLIKALIIALPTGKLNSTNAHTHPFLVLAEEQAHRFAYGFDEAVTSNNGYTEPTLRALETIRRANYQFNPAAFGDAIAYNGTTYMPTFDACDTNATLDDITNWVADRVYQTA